MVHTPNTIISNANLSVFLLAGTPPNRFRGADHLTVCYSIVKLDACKCSTMGIDKSPKSEAWASSSSSMRTFAFKGLIG